jgi:hypothetical protein
MNKITDIIISTQFATVVAAVLAVLADMLEKVGNPNHHFLIYVCLITAAVFMLFPHIVSHGPKQREVLADELHDELLSVRIKATADLAARLNSEDEHLNRHDPVAIAAFYKKHSNGDPMEGQPYPACFDDMGVEEDLRDTF